MLMPTQLRSFAAAASRVYWTAGLLLVAVASLGGAAVALAGERPAARAPKPLPCPGGRFVLPEDSTPLIVGGGGIAPDAVIVSDGQVTIASGCDAAAARLRRGKKGKLLVK